MITDRPVMDPDSLKPAEYLLEWLLEFNESFGFKNQSNRSNDALNFPNHQV
jgi:hypothetical protein